MINAFDQAASYLPPRLRRLTEALSDTQKQSAEEFRLRVGRDFSVTLSDSIFTPSGAAPITMTELELMVETAARGSLHTVLDRICNGYITVEGGHRLGLCGTAVLQNKEIVNLRDLNSCCLRIARERKGAADTILQELRDESPVFPNVLIISPPGGGKTTVLRDLIRQLSTGDASHAPLRVGIADERGELSGCFLGQPQLDVGPNTDILDAAPKAEAALLLLRAMSPQVVALDEITAPEDVDAVLKLCNCGVSVVCTAHAENRYDLLRRSLYRPLQEIFQRIVTVRGRGAERQYTVEPV